MTAFKPSFDGFRTRYVAGKAQCVSLVLGGDLETPVGAYLKLSATLGKGFLLESIEGGAARGRYSILGFSPDLVFRSESENVTVQRGETSETISLPMFDAMRALLNESRIELDEQTSAMAAGIYGVMSYNCVRQIEHVGDEKTYPFKVPDVLLMRPTLTAVFDNVRDEITLVTPVRETGGNAQNAYDAACEKLNAAAKALQSLPPAPAKAADFEVKAPVSNTAEADYLQMVEQAKAYIFAGDAFQIVLSQRFETPFPLPAFSLYRALRRTNPSPYLFFFDYDDFALVGSSPEICVQLKGEKVTLRPIAGTIRRGGNAQEDKANAETLLADPKERAEHLMLLDLGRNDVGRIAETGSVVVEEQFTIERYSEVMHIVSQVGGTLRSGFDAIDVLKAAFPAGTVSGAPKIRAMQIINELEAQARGFYAGCVGYFSANGDMDTAIVLRTGVVHNNTLYVQAGAGIVADSVPQSEQNECIAKARALFRAAELAAEAAR